MDVERVLLRVAAGAYLCAALTGVVAHMKWMDYSRTKDPRSVSITHSASEWH